MLKDKAMSPTKEFLSTKEIAEGLTDKKLYVVARTIGVSYPTLKKFLDGKHHNFTVDTLTKVSNYVRSLPKK